MKRVFTILAALLITAVSASAQTILKGDMNGDDQVTISDVTSLVNVILGKSPQETISVGSNPFAVDNSYVVGTWYAADGTSFTLNEDGTTDFPGGATYKFYTGQNRLLILNASGLAVRVLPIVEATSSYLLAVDYATGALSYYTHQSALATGITLSATTLSINSNSSEQLIATLTPETAFGTIMWSSSDESVATVDANGVVSGVTGGTCTITAKISGSLKTATCTVTVAQMVTSIVLSQTDIILELDEFVRLTATVLPDNAANKALTWSSSNPDAAPVRNGRVDAYDYGTAIITCEAADGSGVVATCMVLIVEDKSNYDGMLNGHIYVDLGLPSGTLWATCNIGATSPEDYGDYFAWGETEGYLEGKTTFTFNTYKWCNGSYKTMTKYCSNSSYGNNGFTDNLTELELEDDAAYINWGSGWRMPSIEQCEELSNSSNTTTEWTTQNGVNGRLITSRTNGKSIFLPAAGTHNVFSLFDYVGSNGGCWSRTLNTTVYSYEARHLNFNSGNVSASASERDYGRSVRPVRSTEQ